MVCVQNFNQSSALEDSCLYIIVLTHANTSFLDYASFHSWCCLTNKKLNLFKKTVFLSEHSAVGIKSYNKCAKCSLSA